LESVNEATKWTVSACVFAAVAYLRSPLSSWWLVGSIVAAVLCKLLKRLINQSRPKDARLTDPGMPSSHATSLAFLSVFVALWVNSAQSELFLSLLAPLVAVLLAILRVTLGFHTGAQVLVGFGFGALCAHAWWKLGIEWSNIVDEYSFHIHAVAIVCALAFAVVNGDKWLSELHATRKLRNHL
jgi:dolichyldiphosphatase